MHATNQNNCISSLTTFYYKYAASSYFQHTQVTSSMLWRDSVLHWGGHVEQVQQGEDIP